MGTYLLHILFVVFFVIFNYSLHISIYFPWLPHAKVTFHCYGVRFLITHDMACDYRKIEYWLKNNRVRNDDNE